MSTTRYYFNDDAGPAVTPASSAEWDVVNDTPVVSKLIVTPGSDGAGYNVPKGTPPRSVIGWKGVSDPLPAGTVSGTFHSVFEIDGAFISGWLRLVARLVSGDGATVRGVLANSVALGTGVDNHTFPSPATMRFVDALTPQLAEAGDRIVVEVGVHFLGGLGGGVLIKGYSSGSPADLPDSHLTSATGRAWFDLNDAPRGLAADPDVTSVDLTWLDDDIAWLGSGEVAGYQVKTDAGAWGAASSMTGHTVSGLDPVTDYDFQVRAYKMVQVVGGEITPASASGSPAHNGGNAPANAFDGDPTGTAWALSSGWNTPGPGMLKATLSVAKTVIRYSIKRWDGTPAATPTAWTFQGSNDNATWTTLDTRAGVTYSSGETKHFDFTNSTSYLYYRWNFTANGGDAWLIIGDAMIWEADTPLTEYSSPEPISSTTLAPPPPPDPTDLVLVPDVTSIDVSWTASDGATGYTLEVNGDAPIDVGNVTMYELTGLTPDTLYEVVLRAYHDYGSSDPVTESTTTLPPVSSPSDLILTPHVFSITASWTPPSVGVPAEGYLLSVNGGTSVDVGDVETFEILGLTPETLYDVDVRAYFRTEAGAYDYTIEGASASAFIAGHEPEDAFDHNSGTYWEIDRPHTGWLQADLGTPQVIGHYTVQAFSVGTAPRDWQLAGSNNGWEWYYIDTRNDIVFADGEVKSFDVPLEWEFRYYLISVTDNGGASQTRIAELDIRGPMTYDTTISLPLSGSTTTLNDGLNNLHVGSGEVAALYVGASPVLRVYSADTLTFEL